MVKNLFYKLNWLISKRMYGYLGINSRILKPSYVSEKKFLYIGNNVTVERNGYIEPITYNLSLDSKVIENANKPVLKIGNNVWIGQGCHINCAQSVLIENDVLISSYVFISDIDHDYSDIGKPVSLQKLIISPVTIKEQAFIGTGVKILAGVTVGKHSVIGANSVVSKDIPDYCVAAGVPAKVIKKYNFEKKTWEKI